MINWTLAKKYPFVLAWGKFMGSMPYYINGELERAEETDAPWDAIYYRESEGWHRWHQVNRDGREEWCVAIEAGCAELMGVDADEMHSDILVERLDYLQNNLNNSGLF